MATQHSTAAENNKKIEAKQNMRCFSESVSVMAVVVLILLSTSNCRAAVPKATDGNHFSVGDANVDFEFMMDSEFSGKLAAAAYSNPYKGLNKNQPDFNCGPAKNYCIPHAINKDCIGIYKKGC
uniref:Uncharacterized protein n=1 Tax=Manihot esculenta TaxID=3983 RepID=A0A2C9WJC8_MANES